ncbi:hypothetical protein ACMC56_13580 [Campylobacterota bacterium DY0563]
MAEKSDEEIVKEEAGLESKITDEEVLAHLSLDNDSSDKDTLKPVDNNSNNNDNTEKPVDKSDDQNTENTNGVKQNIIENEDKDYEKELENDGSKEKEEEELTIQKKQPKIFKILIAIATLLFGVLIIGLILYFIGFFDPEEEIKPLTKVETKKVVPDVVFNEKEIDKKELNKKLTMLTKKEIMSKDELEAEEKRIAEEKKRKEEEQQRALEEKKKEEELKLANQLAKIQAEKDELLKHQEEIKKQQDEFIKLQEQAKKDLEEKMQNISSGKIVNVPQRDLSKEQASSTNEVETTPTISDIPMENDNDYKTFLSFINVATIKGDLYKSYLDKVEKYDKKLSLCRDLKNRIEIYFGPYQSQAEREKVFNSLIENGFKQAYLVDFTEEEYKKRCKY